MQSKHLVLSAAVAAAVLASGSAQAVNYSVSDGTIFSTAALTGFQTDFDDMDGTLVTVTFSDSSIAVASFVDTGAGAGMAENLGNFRVSGSGDTFNVNWTLENLSQLSIDKIEFNGRPGDTIWDRTNPDQGTAGSASGRDLEFVSSSDTSIGSSSVNVFYYDAVKLNSAAAPVRDLYSVYEITFADAAGGTIGLGRGQNLVYRQDADNNRFDSPLIPTVPEASTVISGLALGVLGLIPVVRRFRRA